MIDVGGILREQGKVASFLLDVSWERRRKTSGKEKLTLASKI